MGEHLLQISGVGGGLVRGQVGAGDAFSFGEAALQADDKREVLPYPRSRSHASSRRRAASGGASSLKALIGDNFQRGQIIALRVGVAEPSAGRPAHPRNRPLQMTFAAH